MKKKLPAIAVISLFILLLSGCAVKVSIDERITTFVAGLNQANRDDLKKNISASASIVNTADEAHWENYFPNDSGQTYSLISKSTTGATTRDVKISGGIYTTTYDTFHFTMKEDEPNVWFILTLTVENSSTNPSTTTNIIW